MRFVVPMCSLVVSLALTFGAGITVMSEVARVDAVWQWSLP